LIIVCPDTSPRNVNLPGEDDSWDFGSGAGFYLDATAKPWSENYRMFSYVTSELVDLINSSFPTLPEKQSIFGHSMGGHGALICALKNPGLYKSVSAFAPISNPTKCPWGEKAFSGYLGDDKESWKNWDATELVAKYNGPPLELYIDQGAEDSFLKDQQLLPNNLIDACKKAEMPCILNLREGYDHSYFYISTFVGEHLNYHAKHLLS
jgi:S-formylglutathione hydrolase